MTGDTADNEGKGVFGESYPVKPEEQLKPNNRGDETVNNNYTKIHRFPPRISSLDNYPKITQGLHHNLKGS